MNDYLELGPTPADVDCAQVGTPNFRARAIKETDKYQKFLMGMFGNLPKGVSFHTKWFGHDFGSYAEVVVKYNDNDPLQTAAAFFIEGNLPDDYLCPYKYDVTAEVKKKIEKVRVATENFAIDTGEV